MPTPIEHRTASQPERKPCPAPARNLLIPPPTSRVAFCASPICPTSRSTGSVGMKRYFGAKSAKSCLPSRHWIGENHKTEGAVYMSVARKHCRPMDPTTIEMRAPLILATDPELGRRAIRIVVDGNWVCFVEL